MMFRLLSRSRFPLSVLSLNFHGHHHLFPQSGHGLATTAPSITLLALPVAAYKTDITFAPVIPLTKEAMSESTRRAVVFSIILDGKRGEIGVGI